MGIFPQSHIFDLAWQPPRKFWRRARCVSASDGGLSHLKMSEPIQDFECLALAVTSRRIQFLHRCCQVAPGQQSGLVQVSATLSRGSCIPLEWWEWSPACSSLVFLLAASKHFLISPRIYRAPSRAHLILWKTAQCCGSLWARFSHQLSTKKELNGAPGGIFSVGVTHRRIRTRDPLLTRQMP